jgi:hypothetical protein
VCRADDEREAHGSIVVSGFSPLSYASACCVQRAKNLKPGRRGVNPGASDCENYAAVLGRRPRRLTALPGIFAAQSSQNSAAFVPRRASV